MSNGKHDASNTGSLSESTRLDQFESLRVQGAQTAKDEDEGEGEGDGGQDHPPPEPG